jgi:hypothetical protein
MRLGFAASCAFTLFNVLLFTNAKWLSLLQDPNNLFLSAGLFCAFIMLVIRIYAPESELEKYEISREEIKIIDSSFLLYGILNALLMPYLINKHYLNLLWQNIPFP